MSRTNYNKLNTYNTKPRGTVQGPRVPARVPSMEYQTPLYPKVNHRYQALTFNGGDREYYKIDNGPYGQKCSVNRPRRCTGGPPLNYGRENYTGSSPSVKRHFKPGDCDWSSIPGITHHNKLPNGLMAAGAFPCTDDNQCCTGICGCGFPNASETREPQGGFGNKTGGTGNECCCPNLPYHDKGHPAIQQNICKTGSCLWVDNTFNNSCCSYPAAGGGGITCSTD